MIFFIYGTDHYRVSEKLSEVKTGFIQKRDKAGFNVINLDISDLSLDKFIQEALTTPFLSEKKMVVVKNVLSDKKIGKEIARFLKDNKSRIDNVICFVDLINPEKAKINRDGKLTLTGDLFKLLSKEEYRWEFNNMKDSELNTWIKNYCRQKEIKINPLAINELIIRTGNDLFQIITEINKLNAYKNGKEILTDDIKKLVNQKFDDNIFVLVDSIGNKNKKLALKLISNQLNFGTHPLMLLSMITRQFKILLKTKDKNASAVNLKIHPFIFNKAKMQGQNFEKEIIIKIINNTLEIEKQLKSGEKNPELLFNLFVFRHC